MSTATSASHNRRCDKSHLLYRHARSVPVNLPVFLSTSQCTCQPIIPCQPPSHSHPLLPLKFPVPPSYLMFVCQGPCMLSLYCTHTVLVFYLCISCRCGVTMNLNVMWMILGSWVTLRIAYCFHCHTSGLWWWTPRRSISWWLWFWGLGCQWRMATCCAEWQWTFAHPLHCNSRTPSHSTKYSPTYWLLQPIFWEYSNWKNCAGNKPIQ